MAAGLVLKILIPFLIFSTLCCIVWATEDVKCASCLAIREEIAQARIESIKATILKKLGLKSPPNVHVSPKMRPTLDKVVRYVEHEARNDAVFTDENEAKSKDETIVFGHVLPKGFGGKQAISFRLPSDLKTKEVIAGALKIQLLHREVKEAHLKKEHLDCTVKEIQGSDKPVKIGYHKRHVHGSLPEYAKVTLDVGDLQRWISDDEAVNLIVEAKYRHENLVKYPAADDPYTVFLEIITVDLKSRHKREAELGVCDANMRIKTCCRYDLVIDFHKAGWEFVQFPPTYNAYMCLGECKQEGPDRNGYSLLTSRINQTTSGCCHPSEYEDLEVTFFTEQQTLKRTKIPSLVAKKCICG